MIHDVKNNGVHYIIFFSCARIGSRTLLESIPTFTKKENVNCIYAIGKSHDSSNNMNKSKSVVLCMIYCFKENLLIGGTEYGDIYLWEYEKKFSEDIVFDYDSSARTYGNLDTIESEIGSELNEFTKSLTYSFVCKYIMKEHNMCINSLVLIEQDIIYLVSCCANNMICLWDITNKKFLYQFRINKSLELDGVGNLAYIYNLSHLAFSYTDCNICIFNFDNKNSQINVKYILDKHTDNINNILYNSIKETLVTSSEDGGIRIWDTNNNYCCIYFLQCELTAQIMCINLNTGSIVVAIDNIIKVFHHEEFYVTDAYTGHENTIKKLIHLKKEKKYLTMSNDKTIRFWNTLNSPN
ncbi:hypothetical protein A3Q56_01272 [Intoshia linei]|uniref:Uncharacterized protein n=1 Tax=Intoshia linei TaxID=1819745 RepID=A0A177BBD1_9BILA|nr:hypothetical protein A3Q56_01272 [Intoshia linei]